MTLTGPQDSPDWQALGQVSGSPFVNTSSVIIPPGGASFGPFYVGVYEAVAIGIQNLEAASDAYSVSFVWSDDSGGSSAAFTTTATVAQRIPYSDVLAVQGSFLTIGVNKTAGVDNHHLQFYCTPLGTIPPRSNRASDLVTLSYLSQSAPVGVSTYVANLCVPGEHELNVNCASPMAYYIQVCHTDGTFAQSVPTNTDLSAATFKSGRFYVPRRPWRMVVSNANAAAVTFSASAYLKAD